MGMGTPRYVLPGTAGPQEQQQQQDYMTQFNNAPYAAIPGVRGQQPTPAPYTYTMNGQQRTYDPSQSPPSPTGWGRGLASVGQPMMSELRSLYMNGTMSNADWRGLLPNSQGAQVAQNHMVRPQPSMASQMMTGPYGQQAARMAGLLGRPSEGYPTGGGLLGGPKGGYRPGGK